MDRNSFANRAFRFTRQPGGVRISMPVKSERFRTLLNLVWLLVWVAGEVAIVSFMLGGFTFPGSNTPVSLPLASLILTAFTVAGGIVLWRWLWCVGGKETFHIAGHALSVRREIWGIGHSREFKFEEIAIVKYTRLNYRFIYPSWGRMFIGHGEFEIVIECAGRTHAYGKGLEESEAADLVGLLWDEMGFQSRMRRPPRARSA